MFLNWGFGLVGQWQIMHVGDYVIQENSSNICESNRFSACF